MAFYDRKYEINMLTEKLKEIGKSNKGQMIALYGRRRVGKTRLVQKFLEKIETKRLYLYIDIAQKQVILDNFSKEIKTQLNQNVSLQDFEDFFEYIISISKKENLILVLDEFQRFLDTSPEFITSIQKHWDNTLKDNNIMIILVGSSIGMISRITEAKHGALYGRAQRIKISPFRYVDFREMFKELSEEEKIKRYSVFGGTPYYLEKSKAYPDIITAINELILKKDSVLSDEPKILLEYENVRNHSKYNSILDSISGGKEVLKEISDSTKIPPSSLMPYLRKLDLLLDLVKRNDPLSGKERLGRYKINDNFFKFWYRFIFQNQSSIQLGASQRILEIIKTDLNMYVSRIFEDIIKELLVLYNEKEIKGYKLDFDSLGSWWDKGENEIDIVGRNKKGNRFFAAEVKWTTKLVSLDVVFELERKAKMLRWNGEYKLMIFSKNGFEASCLKKMDEEKILHFNLKEIEELFEKV